MNVVGPTTASPTQSAQAVQAAQANAAAGTSAAQTEVQKLGLPPAALAEAATVNTLNAELAISQWGVDPALVGGVYGGSSASGGLFASTSLLPLLASLSKANAGQALAILGVQTPSPSADDGASEAQGSTTGKSLSADDKAALVQAAAGSSGPAMVDPLWGRRA